MIKLIVFTILDFLMVPVAWILSPFVALFASEEGWLPRWLYWFQTQDADLDRGFRDGNGESISNPFVFWLYHKFRYVRRVFWLCRNPAYYFSYGPLGIPYNAAEWTIVECGENGMPFHAVGPNGAISRHFFWHGLRIKIGVKSWWYYDITAKTFRDIKGERVPFVFSISRAK